MGDEGESFVRRSRRIAAKVEDRSQLMDIVMAEVERDNPSSSKKKSEQSSARRRMNRSSTTKSRDEETGTSFDSGLQAVSILGATSLDDEAKGISELCYLVKFIDGTFELVPNIVAHKYCPLLVIDFLESRILFKEKNNLDINKELFGETSTNVLHIPDSQPDAANQSVEI